MTQFDYAVLLIVAVSTLVGVWRGVISELLALAAWIVAFFVAQEFASSVAPWLAKWIGDPGLSVAAGFVGTFVAVLLGFGLLRLLVSLVLSAVGLALVDRTLGACFGAVRGVVIVLVVVMLAGMTAVPEKTFWQDAVLAPPLETVIIAGKRWMPVEIAKRIKFHR